MMETRVTGKRRIDLVLADVDGTLVTHDKVLTPRTIEAAQKLRTAGVLLAVTSGRPPAGMKMLVGPLMLDSLIAGFNGGLIVKPDMTPIETRALAPEATRRAIEVITGLGLDAWLYSGEDWFVREKAASHVAREAFTVQYQPSVTPLFPDHALDHAAKVVGVSDDHALVQRAEAAVLDALGSTVSATRSQPYYLDVTHPEANKGAVVDAIARQLGVAADRIATIGDGGNDVLMFRRSGLSIAMGNAADSTKQAANVVTDSNERDGFAVAMERFVLGEEPS